MKKAVEDYEQKAKKVFEACKARRWKDNKNDLIESKASLSGFGLTNIQLKTKKKTRDFPTSNLSDKDKKYVKSIQEKIDVLKEELAKPISTE